MVVHDFYTFGAAIRPVEAYAPLVVYPDRVLPGPIARQRFKPISRRTSQVVETHRGVNRLELAARAFEQVGGKAFRALPIENRFGHLVLERPDHQRPLVSLLCIAQRYCICQERAPASDSERLLGIRFSERRDAFLWLIPAS